MQNYARIGIFGILALLALRVGIGWHFFMEGADKIKAGTFSSEGFLTGAKGPLAENFQALIWDHDYKLRLDQGKMNGLFDMVGTQAGEQFKLTDEQLKNLTKLKSDYCGLNRDGTEYVGRLNQIFDTYAEEIHKYREGAERVDGMSTSTFWTGVKSLRGQKDSIVAERNAEIKPAIASIDRLWKQYEIALNRQATAEQFYAAKYYRFKRPGERDMNTRVVDRIIPVFDMVVGILLIVGFLTPFAGWAAGLFLFSVVLTQMPGYPGTAPTYFQAAEGLACIVLATTQAGRYAGLDFIPWAWWNNRKAVKSAAKAAKASAKAKK